MAEKQDQLEIKFRLSDGSDIGPKSFAAATNKEYGPRTVKDVKLICAGKILENNKTVEECQSPLCNLPGGVTTMLVVVQPPNLEKDKKVASEAMQSKCVCVIL
ncbi:hypothetical protein TSUD_285110 [Trifolium subterraneum]|uniref:UBL3-like ubiquitin domain-containing protein n=1 Tax=Trifolium subterraneum TaxID=3900 RepID=A0A2Z6NU05_TRISU|nr:hypothetical protein TSUD_285110 [Trifolium subterraneum]